VAAAAAVTTPPAQQTYFFFVFFFFAPPPGKWDWQGIRTGYTGTRIVRARQYYISHHNGEYILHEKAVDATTSTKQKEEKKKKPKPDNRL
jgi:hypothetical protein